MRPVTLSIHTVKFNSLYIMPHNGSALFSLTFQLKISYWLMIKGETHSLYHKI